MVDIDDTLINTKLRVRSVWNLVLDQDIPLGAIESLSSRQILEKYAASDQGKWNRFWNVLLCSDKSGIELLRFDEAMPFAAEALQKWSRVCAIVYFTGRPGNTRELTQGELTRFGFPTDNAELMMFDPEDWKDFTSVKSLVGARGRVFNSILRKYSIVRVVDDYPTFFNVYKQFEVPDRVGLLRPERFSRKDYLDQGATRVVESWSQLLNDLPTQIR